MILSKNNLRLILLTLSSKNTSRGAFAFTAPLSSWTPKVPYLDLIQGQGLKSIYEKSSLFLKMSKGGGNFFDDFGDGEFLGDDEDGDDEDGDDEDEDDEYADLEVGDFRSRLGSIMGEDPAKDNAEVDELISFATSATSAPTQAPVIDWAKPFPISSSMDQLGSILSPGTILIANPSKFCSDFESSSSNVSPALLSKFGLTLPPPATLGPDRRADLLPVLVILERHPLKGCQAVLLNRRTGYLIGDLEQEQPPTASLPSDFDDGKTDVSKTPITPSDSDSDGGGQRLWAFMIQPLWFGGTSPGDSGGLDMLHPCPMIEESKSLTDDGLFWGGDPGEAQRIMERGDVNVILKGELDDDTGDERKRPLSGFDFKFFVQRTRWLPTQLEKEIRDGTWYAASVSKEVLFKSRDRLGTKRAKPLWTEIMELMGGEYEDVRDKFYEQE